MLLRTYVRTLLIDSHLSKQQQKRRGIDHCTFTLHFSLVSQPCLTSKFSLLQLDMDGAQSQSAKKRKCESSLFSNFTVENILREDLRQKLITIQGSFVEYDDKDLTGDSGSGEPKKSTAVVILERKPFDTKTIQNYLNQTTSSETLNNDIYSTHDVYPMAASADMKATVIHPATEKHIAKYSEHEPFVVHETPALYDSVTLPCLQSSKFSIQWVYNILAKQTESERIVVEDPDQDCGFVMLPDMKWDRKNMDSLYLIVIIHKHGLKSLRDLRKEHLPLLKNILDKGRNAIREQFGIPTHKLRIYFHYQPSYYHLHVHFTHIKFEAPGSDVMRAHLLEDVIDNIEKDSEFYSKKTLSYVVRDNDALYKAYQNHGYFKS